MINIKNLYVNLGDFSLEDISLTVNEGDYFVILGPTGAGKTVLLESIAGLNPIKRGAIFLKDRDITREKPEQRGISIVYQDHALFPHLSVKGNILFGLKLRRKKSQEMTAVLEWLTDLFGISSLLHRKPQTLSGGERQKVALARALSTRPDVLLLDEPLSALDPGTREAMQEELYRLHRTLKSTVVHVTHDFEEAMALGNRIAVIGDGRLKQAGTPEQIFRRPDSEFVARFTMMRNIFTGEMIKKPGGDTVFRTDGVEISIPDYREGIDHLGIRPDDIDILPADTAHIDANTFSGTVTRIVDKGPVLYVTVRVPPDFCCLVTRRDRIEKGLEEGKQVKITFKADSAHPF
jgi:ABC-type Fe3+/spermidine/putrescine transport system ATPase subunit